MPTLAWGKFKNLLYQMALGVMYSFPGKQTGDSVRRCYTYPSYGSQFGNKLARMGAGINGVGGAGREKSHVTDDISGSIMYR